MRKVLGIEYKGTRYFGWQKQKKIITVQGELEKALKKFLSKNKVETFGSGRTDTGVHASFQVVHFDTDIKRPKRSWIKGLNSLLPDDISVHSVFDTHDEFHSRFSAIDRSYRYIIYNSPFRKSLFADYFCWYPNSLLDEKKMQLCEKYLLGEKNFSSFIIVKYVFSIHKLPRHARTLSRLYCRDHMFHCIDVIPKHCAPQAHRQHCCRCWWWCC